MRVTATAAQAPVGEGVSARLPTVQPTSRTLPSRGPRGRLSASDGAVTGKAMSAMPETHDHGAARAAAPEEVARKALV